MWKRLAALIVCVVVVILAILRAKNPAELPFDASILRFFHSIEHCALTLFFNVMSWLGSILVVGPLSIFLSRRVVRLSRRDAWALVLSAIGASLVHTVIKMSIPWARLKLFLMLGVHPGEGIFPSGHAVNVTAIFLAIALVSFRVWLHRACTITAICAVIIPLVGIGRLYLQVHWLSDVLAGWFIGAVWVLLVDVVVGDCKMK